MDAMLTRFEFGFSVPPPFPFPPPPKLFSAATPFGYCALGATKAEVFELFWLAAGVVVVLGVCDRGD